MSTHHSLVARTDLAVEELVVTSQDGIPHIHKLSRSMLTVGRDNNNDIVLKGTAISRRHVQLEWEHGVWFVSDLGSTNGSSLTGMPLAPRERMAWLLNDVLQIGSFTLHLRRGRIDFEDRTEFVTDSAEIEALRAEMEGELDDEQSAEIQTKPPELWSANAWPAETLSGEEINIAIQNIKTVAQKFTIEIASGDALHFVKKSAEITVPAGTEKRFITTAHAIKRPVLIKHATQPYQVTIQTPDHQTCELAGSVNAPPHLSRNLLWFLALLPVWATLSFLLWFFLFAP